MSDESSCGCFTLIIIFLIGYAIGRIDELLDKVGEKETNEKKQNIIMSNKENRLILDIIKQKAKINNQEIACVLSEEFLGIQVKPVPTFRKILFKKVLVPHNKGVRTIRILKSKHKAN